jgi:choline dehydrogenase-like flavoprotein
VSTGEEFDVVVVGAGSAGCALAARLSEDPSLRVLLLEAGGSDDVLEVQVPAALSKVWRTRRDWNYTTEPQPALGGRRLFWPRGKLLGGSSSINAMIYVRGGSCDYDEWAELTGDPSWSYEHVLPLFRTVRTGALTTRVLLSGGRATGVEYRSGGQTRTAHAAAEVVLAGGAVNSPQLLMLSGIGPGAHLREVGVDVVHDLPGVGGGLQDHPLVPVVWHTRSGRSLSRAESPSGYARWFGTRRGPLTSNLAEAGLFTRSRAELPEPDLQHHFLPVKFWRQAEVDPDVDAFTAAAVLVRVHSRGRCGCTRPTRPGHRPSTPATSPTNATSTRWCAGSRRRARSRRPARWPPSWPRSGPPAGRCAPGRGCGRRCATPSSRCTTRCPRAGWAPTTTRWSTRSCGCTASTGCGWSTPR